jgi:hypothetical protein
MMVFCGPPSYQSCTFKPDPLCTNCLVGIRFCRKEHDMGRRAPAGREVPVCAGPGVSRSEWAGFCNAFGRMHRGWLVTVTMLDSAAPQGVVLARELPLESVAVVHRDGEVQLRITVRRNGSPLSCPVRHPERLVLEQSAGGVEEVLCIGTADGQVLRVRFRVPVTPESLDGLTDAER